LENKVPKLLKIFITSNMRHFFHILVANLIALGALAQIPQSLQNKFQETIEMALISPGVKGISACVIMPDESIWLGQAGVNGAGDPITDTTLFYAGSTTKNFIATRILQLWDAKQIDLDTTYTAYIDTIDFLEPQTTIRQLLNHTSGVYDYLNNPSFLEDVFSNFDYIYSPAQVLNLYLNQPHIFQPGTNFQYSNSNYIVLGLIIEGITGEPFGKQLRDHIFNVVPMPKTYVGSFDTITDPHCGLFWSVGGSPLVDYSAFFPHNSLLSGASAAGNLVSYPMDEARYIRKLINGQLLSEEAMEQMLTMNPFSGTYGLGIISIDAGVDTLLLGHTGDIGNITEMFHCPQSNVTIVVMQNSRNATLDAFIDLFIATQDFVLSSAEPFLANTVVVFPNPTQNLLTVTNLPANFSGTISIFNTMGQWIATERKLGQEFSISTEFLPPGLHIIQLESDNGERMIKKIIKK
jgi:D-alanyl-D-alanine carboxypeptidase